MASNPLIRVDRQSPVPIFRQLEEQILYYIQTGDLKPGDRIPSQYELSRDCQISRATVQKALDHLMADEVLYFRQGKGIYVAAPVERQRLPVLQSISNSLRDLGHKVHADLLQAEETEASSYVAKALRLLPRSPVIYIRRLQYIDDTPAVLQESHLEAERFRGIMAFDLRQQGLTQAMHSVGDLVIRESTLAIGAQDTNWEESRIMNIQAGSSLLTIEELDFEEEMKPVRLSRNKLRSDRFRVLASTMQDCRISLEYRLQPGIVNFDLT